MFSFDESTWFPRYSLVYGLMDEPVYIGGAKDLVMVKASEVDPSQLPKTGLAQETLHVIVKRCFELSPGGSFASPSTSSCRQRAKRGRH